MRKFIRIAAAAAIALSAGTAAAAQTTTSFQVNATVIGTCIVSAADLEFGDYSPIAATPADASSSVTVQCTLLTPYAIGLDAGAGSGASVATRKMTKATDTLTYSLYQDAGRLQVWGNTFGTDTVSGAGNGAEQIHTVYGRIPSGQNVNAGVYSDTISVTVDF